MGGEEAGVPDADNRRSRVVTVGERSAHLPAHMVRRPRLLEALDAPGARLVVVTGPAGSGKTVAVRDWRSTASDPTGWLSLESRHGDPEHFMQGLVSVLEDLAPGVRAAMRRDDLGDHPPGAALGRAVGHLAAAPAATLVLDDLHVIDRSASTDLLGRLVDVVPDTNLTLVICSRSDPPFPLHRFRLAGELVELREADLRFDRDEAAEFFSRFPQVRLTPDHIDRLADRTEGWAAGLQFAALSLAGRAGNDTDAFVDRFAGSDRHVADFLLDEVLDRQPPEVREFLLATSVLERLRADLCEYVAGPEAARLLRRVEAEHLFLLPLDDDREWFRYHHLFGQLLRREVHVARPDQERRSNARAAAWFRDHGHADLAIDHLLDAGEDEEAFSLFTARVREHLIAGRLETVRGWMARFPDDFVGASPSRQLLLSLAYGWCGQIQRSADMAHRARATLRSGGGHGGDGDGADAEAVYVDLLEAMIAVVQGDPERAIALGEPTWERREGIDMAALGPELAATSREMWAFLPVAIALAHALLDDRAGTRRWAAAVRRDGPRLPGDLVSTLGAEAWVEARSGRLRVAHELAQQALALGAEHGRLMRRPLAGSRVALALVHRERDQLDQAEEAIAPHVQAAVADGQLALATLGEVELARIEAARGRPDEGIARLLRVRRERAEDGTPRFLGDLLDRTECRLRLRMGDLDRAQDLLEDLPTGTRRTLLEARLALAAGRPERADALLAGVSGFDGDRHRLLEVAALRARVTAAAGDLAATRRILNEVSEVAQREGAVRVFLDEGFDILDLVPSMTGERSRPAPGNALVEALSEREMSVLRYLPSRLSNREIGDELYVSLNTVKSHLKTIYRKLDVDRRDAAVRRARQLGLL
jgi:LuxR family transcriptional regulator, maltose regulon positive regulatory protein